MMSNASNFSPRKQLFLLTFAHAVVDTYSTTLPHLLPLLFRKLVSQTASWGSLAGQLIAISGVFNSLSQVIFGRLADRAKIVHFLSVGVALPAICTSLLGIVPSIPLLMLLMVTGGMGAAAFHPPAAVQAATLAKQGRGFGVALFITGGNVGQAVGPFCIMLFLNRYGLERLVWCMIPGILIALLVAKTLSVRPSITAASPQGSIGAPALPQKKEQLWQVIRPQLRTLIVLYLITTLRTVTTVGVLNFLSLYLDQQQYSTIARSAVLSLFIFAGSMGIMTGGWLPDRINRYDLLLFSLIAAPPILYASLHSTGILFLILLFLGNMILSSSITVNIVLAQQLLPENESLASSLMMGAAWGMAGMLNYPVGILADRVGLPNLLDGLVLLPLVTAFLMIFLKRDWK
ncbi:MAG: MFS transporter [Candidatus Poribacteria bacterium]|nr:MFS transporter [Candidatus Poribacteria bacterium]